MRPNTEKSRFGAQAQHIDFGCDRRREELAGQQPLRARVVEVGSDKPVTEGINRYESSSLDTTAGAVQMSFADYARELDAYLKVIRWEE